MLSLLCLFFLFQVPAYAQQLISVSPNSVAPANSRYVGSYTHPVSGRQYDRYAIDESFPVQRMEPRQVTERRWVPQWVLENQRTTVVQYVPEVQYQPQMRVANRWNPFTQPQASWEYVPVTQYKAVNQIVEQPVQYQKYVEQDVAVSVPNLVQTTETRQRFEDVERNMRSGSPISSPASNVGYISPATNPLQNSGTLALNNRNGASFNYNLRPMDPLYQAPGAGYPYSPYASMATVAWNSPYAYSASYNPTLLPGGSGPILAMNPMQTVAYPQGGNVVNTYPVSYTAGTIPTYPNYPNGNYRQYASAPSYNAWPWSSWSNSQGPLFGRNLFQQNQTVAMSPPPMNGTIYPTANYASLASQSSITGTLRPSSSPLLPQSAPSWNGGNGSVPFYRDPGQVGLPATVLR
jgi:hypothetical protein